MGRMFYEQPDRKLEQYGELSNDGVYDNVSQRRRQPAFDWYNRHERNQSPGIMRRLHLSCGALMCESSKGLTVGSRKLVADLFASGSAIHIAHAAHHRRMVCNTASECGRWCD